MGFTATYLEHFNRKLDFWGNQKQVSYEETIRNVFQGNEPLLSSEELRAYPTSLQKHVYSRAGHLFMFVLAEPIGAALDIICGSLATVFSLFPCFGQCPKLNSFAINHLTNGLSIVGNLYRQFIKIWNPAATFPEKPIPIYFQPQCLDSYPRLSLTTTVIQRIIIKTLYLLRGVFALPFSAISLGNWDCMNRYTYSALTAPTIITDVCLLLHHWCKTKPYPLGNRAARNISSNR